MIKIGQPTNIQDSRDGPRPDTVAATEYRNPDNPQLAIEAISLESLLGRIDLESLDRPERPNFHVLILCLEGHSTHYIDFKKYEWKRGTLLHVHPGQVQQFKLTPGMQAQLLFVEPGFLSSHFAADWNRTDRRNTNCFHLNLDEKKDLQIFDSFIDLVSEYHSSDFSGISLSLLFHQLQVLLLRMHLLAGVADRSVATDSMQSLYGRFVDDIDHLFMQSRVVEMYAVRLGCSTKSLARACESAAGQSPKKIIEQRVVLEAQRLLVHTKKNVKTIARELGFSEETNFVKFFKNNQGLSPLTFRTKNRWENSK
jgi:AraC-like DNA-binding protein